MAMGFFSGSNNGYNPDEPRDERGRWTSGGASSPDWPLRDPSPAGRAWTLLGHGMLPFSLQLPTQAEAERFSRMLAAWNAAEALDDQSFHDRFTGALVKDLAITRLLREAARNAAEARTIDQMIAASRPLARAIKAIGPNQWPTVVQALEATAESPPAQGKLILAGFTTGETPYLETRVRASLQAAYQALLDAKKISAKVSPEDLTAMIEPLVQLLPRWDAALLDKDNEVYTDSAFIAQFLNKDTIKKMNENELKTIVYNLKKATTMIRDGDIRGAAQALADVIARAGADRWQTLLKPPGQLVPRNASPAVADQADDVDRLMRRQCLDDFETYAFPLIFYCEGGVNADPRAGLQLPTLADALLSRAVSDDDKKTILKGLKIDGKPIAENRALDDILNDLKNRHGLSWKNGDPKTEMIPALYGSVLNYALKKVTDAKGHDILKDIADRDARFLFADALFSSGPGAGAAKIRQAIEETWRKFNITPESDETMPRGKASKSFMENATLKAYESLANNSTTKAFLLNTLRDLIDKQFSGRSTNRNSYEEHRQGLSNTVNGPSCRST